MQLVIVVGLLTLTTLFFKQLSALDGAAVLTFILLSLINIGALLEQRRWIYYLECFRLILTTAYIFYSFNIIEYLALPVLLFIVLERVFSLSDKYYKYVLDYQKTSK
ncbi:hypothetical protein [Pedobacter sp. Leaf132]|uniref:hypothetical protein n=1 Tax=Pedobacter sp. Leaf132 TaxID=2876557 RepID=UPI001E3CC47F|nr:hypothetical protein [Pedobacter sp. Leaf132]